MKKALAQTIFAILVGAIANQPALGELPVKSSSLCDKALSFMPFAAEKRALPWKYRPLCKEVSSFQMQQHVLSLSKKSNHSIDIKSVVIVGKKIGLIPPDYDYVRCNEEGLQDSAYALYDRTLHTFFIRNDVKTPVSIVVHELVHALQDQHFNLTKITESAKTTDQDMAISALIEGDATAVEEIAESSFKDQYIGTGEKLTGDGYQSNCTPPEPLLSIGLFPYEWGSRFTKEFAPYSAVPNRQSIDSLF